MSLDYIDSLKSKKDGKLILVTAINPTPRAKARHHHRGPRRRPQPHRQEGHDRAARTLARPLLRHEGGAAGGGYAQIVPMEDINLHFTGDFHAITSAHNLLSAMIDNHIYWGNELGIDTRRVAWRA